jgi:aspartate oxidase
VIAAQLDVGGVTWQRESEVAIVGAGAAGLSAALRSTATAARNRTESRGCHQRSDFSDPEPEGTVTSSCG